MGMVTIEELEGPATVSRARGQTIQGVKGEYLVKIKDEESGQIHTDIFPASMALLFHLPHNAGWTAEEIERAGLTARAEKNRQQVMQAQSAPPAPIDDQESGPNPPADPEGSNLVDEVVDRIEGSEGGAEFDPTIQ